MYRNRKKERLENWERKTIQGKYLRQTKDMRNQCIRTNLIKTKTEKVRMNHNLDYIRVQAKSQIMLSMDAVN